VDCPRVSFVIATYNRRNVLLHTLARIYSCGLCRGEFEVLLLYNASTNATA
jgi:glycosyltransferase involved in cell wall biosynthesis